VAPRGRESVLEPLSLEGGDTGGNGLITSIVAAAWKGAAITSSFGGVDDEAATNGRATQTDLRSEKKNSSNRVDLRVQSRVHLAGCPPPYPHLFPPSVKKTEGERHSRGGEVRPELQLRSGLAPPASASSRARQRWKRR